MVAFLVLAGCSAKLHTKETSGASVPATATATDVATDPSTSTEPTPATPKDNGHFEVSTVDLGGLNTVSTDFGPLKGFTIQAPNGIDPDAKIAVEIDEAKTFPFMISGDKPLTAKIRISVPDASLAGIDLSHPETISVYVRKDDGTMLQLDAADVSIVAPKVYLLIGDYVSIVILQSRPPLTVSATAANGTTSTPTVTWTEAPVGANPTYAIQVYQADCTTLVQQQDAASTSAAIAPPLAAGSYCVKVVAKIEGGHLESTGEPLHLTVAPATPAAFTFTSTNHAVSTDGRPTIVWSDAARTVDPSVKYDLKISTHADCSAPVTSVTALAVATYRPSQALSEGTYFVCVDATNGAANKTSATGNGSFDFLVDFPDPPVAPPDVSGLGATADSATQITLNWTSGGGTTASYKIAYVTGLTPPANCAAGTVLSAGTTTKVVTALAPSTLYTFRVCALDAAATLSSAGVNVNQTTLTLPGAFTISSATSGNGQSIVTWTASSGAASYTLKYGVGTGNYATTVSTAATSPATVTGLNNGTPYFFMVTAVNAGGTTNATAEASAVPSSSSFPVIINGLNGSNNKDEVPSGVVVQSDGKIVVAGSAIESVGGSFDFALARLTTGAALDSSFATDNSGKVHYGVHNEDEEGKALAMQSDGKLVVVGAHDGAGNIVRFSAAGVPDAGYGSNGEVLVNSCKNFNAVAVQSDDKIIAAGVQAGQGANNNFCVARLSVNGTMDSGFGTGGIAVASWGGFDSIPYAVAIQKDGKILVGGKGKSGGMNLFSIVRFTSVGVIDTTYDTDGIAETLIGAGASEIHGLALQSDGKVVAVGKSAKSADTSIALARFTTTGALDTTFNSSGIVVTSISAGSDAANAVVIQGGDGKIVVAGETQASGGDDDFIVLRYLNTGALDTTFNSAGYQTVAISSGNDKARALALDATGNYYVAGETLNAPGNNDFAVTRIDVGGPRTSTIAASVGAIPVNPCYSGDGTWSSFSLPNVLTDADNGASANTGSGCSTSDDDTWAGLRLFGYFSGAGAHVAGTIDGIEVQCRWRDNSTNIAPFANADVRLVKAGTPGGAPRSAAVPIAVGLSSVMGSPTDLWGTTWTAAEINAGNFGIEITGNVDGNGDIFYIDYCQMKVTSH